MLVVPELSMKGCERQEDLRMPRCPVGVDVEAGGRENSGTLHTKVLDSWSLAGAGLGEDLAQGISGLTGAAFLSEEDLTCWDGAERRPPAEAEGWMTFSAGSQGSYERKAVGKSQEDKPFC